MGTLDNDLFLRALLRLPTERTPVWIMRQAGRYLREYKTTRTRAGDFMSLCKTPELACEVTLQPLDRFNLDAAILFSDILTVPDAMGMELHFAEGEGPLFDKPVRCRADIEALNIPDPEDELGYVMDAVRTIRTALDGRVPLIGFSGSPWTLATYAVEGGSTRDFNRIKSMIFDCPDDAHRLLSLLADVVVDYLNGQVAAGAQALMVFDTWGGVLSPRDYSEFSLSYMNKIVANVTREAEGRRVPIILFTKNGGSGWRRWRIVVVMRWELTGLPASLKHVVGLEIGLHSRETWIQLFCSPRRIVSDRRLKRYLRVMALGLAMSLILGMAFTSPPTRKCRCTC